MTDDAELIHRLQEAATAHQWPLFADAAARLAELRAQYAYWTGYAKGAEKRAEAAETECKKLREIVRDAATWFSGGEGDSVQIAERARAALAAKGAGT